MEKLRIKVLGVCASPRKGNSEFLLEKALEDVSQYPFDTEVATYFFQGKDIRPCISCFKCLEREGQCVLKDDFEELRRLWIGSDVVIYSVPVYHLSIPGQLKCFIDRLGNAFYGFYPVPSVRHLKVIGILTQGMHLFGGQELAMSFLIHHAVLLNSIPVSGDGWHSYIGAAGWTGNKLDRDALAQLHKQDDLDAGITITAAKSVVKRATEMAAMVKTGSYHLQDKLGDDPRYGPYLKRLRGNKGD
ncbi:MAG: flavodoxin family protein [Deltaproteobacteria bacterium]|nr:flavodoxin family protein [Deltaproteobacteria bacterium]